MNKYTFLPHTADIRLQVTGASLEQLFENALNGMNYIIKPGLNDDVKNFDVHEKINIKSIDSSVLLIDFLSQVLTLDHLRHAVFCKINWYYLNPKEASAEISGNRVENFDDDIKAVTYHEVNIHRSESGLLKTVIVFDI